MEQVSHTGRIKVQIPPKPTDRCSTYMILTVRARTLIAKLHFRPQDYIERATVDDTPLRYAQCNLEVEAQCHRQKFDAQYAILDAAVKSGKEN